LEELGRARRTRRRRRRWQRRRRHGQKEESTCKYVRLTSLYLDR
jgi:hypothetical protein